VSPERGSRPLFAALSFEIRVLAALICTNVCTRRAIASFASFALVKGTPMRRAVRVGLALFVGAAFVVNETNGSHLVDIISPA
jgi:hypothetical protein